MERYEILRMIPKPKNKDVIVYDLSLTHLLEVDVFENYNKNFSEFKIKKENYILLDNEIKEYEKTIDNIYLYDKKWTELDYMEMIQNERKTYNVLFGDIKKIENNISILENKLKTINERIEIQRNRDIKEIEDKKKNIDNEISETREKILEMTQKINEKKAEYRKIEIEINNNKDDLETLLLMQQSLEEGNYKCKYCGTVITHASSKKRVAALLQKNIEKNEAQFLKLKSEFDNITNNLNFYEQELSSFKSNLKNCLEFKKTDYNFYIKKSIKVLELEGIRDQTLINIISEKSKLESNTKIKSQDFTDIKNRISKYELSLENMKKIKESKEEFKSKYEQLNILKTELTKLNDKIKVYIKFIEIYYKIYEQKINDFFGKDVKFKLFKIEKNEIKETFEVYYKGVEYTQLSPVLRKEFDEIYKEKVSYIS